MMARRAANGEQNAPAAGTGAREIAIRRESSAVKRALKILGPGLVTGAADDDPSGVGTYAVAGASLGYATLWTIILTVPMMVAAQLMSAKVALVTGRGLAGVLRRHYRPIIVLPAVFGLVIANTINAGADIGAIAAAINLLAPIPIIALIIPIAAVILALQVMGSYRQIASVFKWMTLALFAYIGASLFARPDFGAMVRGTLLPAVTLNGKWLTVLVAVLGTTLSPYMWFWQASQEVEEQMAIGHTRLRQRRGTSDTEVKYAAWDVNVGMLFSNVVAYFIILATAATLFKAGHTDITSAAEAADALRPLAGDASRLLFALGLAGSGFLAVPVLTGSGAYALAEALGWRVGLNEKPRRARGFYAIVAGSTIVGMAINFAGINPIDALFWTAVINGFLTPPLLGLLMHVSNNKKVMGERVNGLGLNVVGWLTTAVMAAAAVGLVLTWGKS
jgi:NRAMP (natural resistance-associated macrophage protein)-like metal ion transporter